MVLDEHSDLDVLWHDGMIIFEIGTLMHVELHGGSSSSGGFLGAAVGSSGGLGSLLDTDNQQKSKKSQQVSYRLKKWGR